MFLVGLIRSVSSREGKINFTPSKIGAYWSSNIEIDVVAIDEERKRVLLGECKYYVQPVDADVLFELKGKTEKITELSCLLSVKHRNI